MAQSASVAKLSIRHDAILHFMLSNPTLPRRVVAARFNVTEAWLSIVCNSQAFMEARGRLTEEVFHETVLPMREKLLATADKAVDRMMALVPLETNLDVVRKTAESVLAACGYASPPPVKPAIQQNIQNNFYGNASQEVLARARERIGQRRIGPSVEEVEHVHEAAGVPAELVGIPGSDLVGRGDAIVESLERASDGLVAGADLVGSVFLDNDDGVGQESDDGEYFSGDADERAPEAGSIGIERGSLGTYPESLQGSSGFRNTRPVNQPALHASIRVHSEGW